MVSSFVHSAREADVAASTGSVVTDVTETGGSRGRGQPEYAAPAPAGPVIPAGIARPVIPAARPAAHRTAVDRLQAAYAAIPPGSPVRLAKRTSNLFRFRDAAATGAPGAQVVAGTGGEPEEEGVTGAHSAGDGSDAKGAAWARGAQARS